MDEIQIKNQAVYWAWESHANRFNVEQKPSPEELIEAARKFENYFRGG
jgi:hypothetical protein